MIFNLIYVNSMQKKVYWVKGVDREKISKNTADLDFATLSFIMSQRDKLEYWS